MLLDGNFQDEDFTDPDDNDDSLNTTEALQYESRPVPGVTALLMNALPKRPYPYNVYHVDDQSHSGLLGTMHPDRGFVPLAQGSNVDSLTWFWDDRCACRVPGTVVWDGIVAGSLKHFAGPDESHLRTVDASLMGEWPNHPPRASRPVNPITARKVAEAAEQEQERNRDQWNS